MPGTVLKTLNVLLLFTVRIILWDNNLNFSSFNGWENWSKVHYLAQGKVYNDMQKYLGSFRSGSPEKGFWNYVGIGGSHEGTHRKGNSSDTIQTLCGHLKGLSGPCRELWVGMALQKGPALESCGWVFLLPQWLWVLISGWVWKEKRCDFGKPAFSDWGYFPESVSAGLHNLPTLLASEKMSASVLKEDRGGTHSTWDKSL